MPAGAQLLLDIAPNQMGSARHIARVRQADVVGVPCATADGHLRLLLRKR
ncbi:hypothetical protein [Nitratidesulfovibrio termitidis]|nr:hypothetical protein [Nitratidesulfovibrio termitidis]